MPLVLAGATSGQATLQATDAATVTLTLPASTGTLVVTGGAQTIEFADGSAAAPSITNSGDTNTGMFFPAADTIAFTEGGVESMRIDSSGNVGIGTTSPSDPLQIQAKSAGQAVRIQGRSSDGYGSLSFYNNANNTLNGYLDVNNANMFFGTNTSIPLIFYTNGTERMRIDSSGKVGIGTSSITGKFTIYNDVGSNYHQISNITRPSSTTPALFMGTNGNSNNAAIASNNANLTLGYDVSNTYTAVVTINTSGDFIVASGSNINSPSTYSVTTGNAANMNVGADGYFRRSTSSLKYKTNVQDATHGLVDVLKLRSVTYQGKSKADGDKVFGGLIAEEVHEAGLTEFVQYAEDGTPDALAYGNMVSLCIKAIQEQQAMITELKATVDAQAARIAALEGAK